MSDNVAAVCYIRKEGGAHSLSLYREVRDLLLWCPQHGIELFQLSRKHQILSTEWTVRMSVFRRLLHVTPDIELDLFSPFPDPLAWRVDALSFPWGILVAYAYPHKC